MIWEKIKLWMDQIMNDIWYSIPLSTSYKQLCNLIICDFNMWHMVLFIFSFSKLLTETQI